MSGNVGRSYFRLPRSAIDAVQSGTLPYDVFNPLIGRIGGATNSTSSSVSPQDIAYTFCVWFTPTLVVLAVLVLMTFSIPLSGCIFLFLRKRGHCCAKKHDDLLSHHGFKCSLLLLVFIMFHISLLIGIFFGFISNGQLSSSLTDLTTSANSSLTNGFEYARSTVDELNSIFVDQFEMALSSANTDLGNASGLLVMPALNMIRPTFSSLLSNATRLLNHLDTVYANVRTINQSIVTLQNHALDINTTLLSLQVVSDNFTVACSTDLICEETIPIVPFFNGLDELENPLDSISAFNDVNLNDIRGQLNDQSQILANISRLAVDKFNDSELPYNSSALSSIVSTLDSIKEYLDQVQTTGNRTLEDYLNLADTFIQRYEIYRNVAGYVLFLVFAALLLPFVCGLICGIAGYRKQRPPFYRTVFSNRGALTIMIGVGASFSFSGLLLIFPALLYTFSTLLQKVCNDLSPPDYVFFTNTLDNRTLWGGSTFLGTLLSDQGNSSSEFVDLSATRILTDCSNNAPLYQAIQGPTIFDLPSLVSPFSSAERPPFDFAPIVDEATNEVLPSSTRMKIQGLPQSIGSATHLPIYINRLSRPILSSNLTNFTTDLNDLVLVYEFMNMTGQAMFVQDVRNTLVPQVNSSTMLFNSERNRLRIQLSNLENALRTTRTEVDRFILSFDTFRSAANSSFSEAFDPFIDRLFSYFSDYGEQLENSIENNVGRCQPVADMYRELHAVVCAELLDGMNGLWCSMLWCVCACLCLIIAGTTMTIFFQRSDVQLGDGSSSQGYGLPGYPNVFRNVNPFAQPPGESIPKPRKHTRSSAIQQQSSCFSLPQPRQHHDGHRHSRQGREHQIHEAPSRFSLQQPLGRSYPIDRESSNFSLLPLGIPSPIYGSVHESPPPRRHHHRDRDRHQSKHSHTNHSPSACLKHMLFDAHRKLSKYVQFHVVVLDRKKSKPQHKSNRH